MPSELKARCVMLGGAARHFDKLHGWEIESPIHSERLHPERTLVKYHFVIAQTNLELQVKDRFCLVLGEIRYA